MTTADNRLRSMDDAALTGFYLKMFLDFTHAVLGKPLPRPCHIF